MLCSSVHSNIHLNPPLFLPTLPARRCVFIYWAPTPAVGWFKYLYLYTKRDWHPRAGRESDRHILTQEGIWCFISLSTSQRDGRHVYVLNHSMGFLCQSQESAVRVSQEPIVFSRLKLINILYRQPMQ